MSASYVPGTGTALLGPRCAVLLPGAASPRLVEILWAALQGGSDLSALARLLAEHAWDLPGFGVAEQVMSGWRLLVRGSVLGQSATGEEVTAGDCVTWQERQLPAGTLELRVAGELPLAGPLPCGPGAVLAGSLLLEGAVGIAPAEVVAGREPQPAQEPVAVEPTVDLGESPVEDSDPKAPDTSSPSGDALSRTLTFRDAQPEQDAPVDGLEEGDVQADPVESYDHLFGVTIHRAPAALPDPEPVAAVVPPPPQVADSPSQAEPVVVEPGAADGLVGLIDAVPVSGAPAVRTGRPVPLPAAPPSAADEPVDERTVARSDIQQLVNQQAEAPVDRLAPTVHAVRCIRGHLNDPHASACRQCGEVLPEQEPVTVPRPVLGRLVLSSGESLTLDRGVLVGRSPSSDRVGLERPHLVKMNSASNDVSRNHASIELDGWHVLVRDLRSTNGTLVQPPGQEPQRLRPDDPQLIAAGTLVILADGVTLRYEVTP